MRLQKKYLPELLEATYDAELSHDAWAKTVSAAFGRVVGSRETAFNLAGYEVHEHVLMKNAFWYASERIQRITRGYGMRGMDSKTVYAFPRNDFLPYFFPRHVVTTQTEIERLAGVSPGVRDARKAAELGDIIGIILHPDSGMCCTLSAGLARATKLGRAERSTLTRVGLHLENALRLRLSPQSVAMVVTPEGRVLHSTAGAMKTPVVAIERARSDAELRLAAWTALVSGRFSMVEREQRGVPRHYVLLENPPAGWTRRGLTPVESSAVQQTARGLPGKLIAYSLGISAAMVSTALSSAAAKLGFLSPVELARAVRVLLEEGARYDVSSLSEAERDVYDLLLSGGTNREIGQKRGTSARTVANQVAAILKKTGAPTRRSLQVTS